MGRSLHIRIAVVLALFAASAACAAVQPDLRASEDVRLWGQVDRVGRRMIATARMVYPEHTWRIGVLEGEPFVAASLSDGSIGIGASLMRDLAFRDDELAWIIGHEMSHVARDHGADRIACAATSCLLAGTGIVTGFVVLPITGGLIAFGGIEAARTLTVTAYSRSQETEADADGLALIVAARYRSDAAVRALVKLDDYEQHLDVIPSLTAFSTHPSTANRIKAIQALIGDASQE